MKGRHRTIINRIGPRLPGFRDKGILASYEHSLGTGIKVSGVVSVQGSSVTIRIKTNKNFGRETKQRWLVEGNWEWVRGGWVGEGGGPDVEGCGISVFKNFLLGPRLVV